jgi:type I restriction enzyme S subunit
MSSDFVVTTIGNACEISTGFPFKSDGYCAKSDSIKLLRGDNIAQGSLRWDGVKRWNPEALEHSVEAKYSLRSGDVVVAMDRPWIEAGLKFAAIQESDLPCLLVQRVACLRARTSVDQGFLRYVVSDYAFTSHVLAVQTGTAVPHISSKQIAEYEFAAPPLEEQKVIAHILGTLDDKIELNRKTNETLEAIAKALFKSWFVDFDPVRAKAEGRPTGLPAEISDLFPDSFEDSELGEIPSGWSMASLGDYVSIRRGGSPRPIHDFMTERGLPWVKISDATSSSDRFIPFTKGFIKEEGLAKTVLLKKSSLILSNSATPGIPKFLGLDACIHDGWLYFPEKACLSDLFLYQFFLWIRPSLVLLGNGSVFTNLKTDILKSYRLSIPPPEIVSAFDEISQVLHDQCLLLSITTSCLAELRDSLLPRLISGEIRIPDAEKMLEEVGV